MAYLEIPLNKGAVAIIDSEDYHLVSDKKWRLFNQGYVMRTVRKDGKKKRLFMHNVIMRPPLGMEVDHINGNPTDNRRSNLRICTHQQNCWNTKIPKHNTSGIMGVCWRKTEGCFSAQIKLSGKTKWLGRFKTAVEAGEAYKAEAIAQRGEFARLA